MKLQIDDRRLAPGSRLPSIRNLAKTLNVSRFTVVESYDRLVALGYLQSRPGAGFYVAALAAFDAVAAPLESYERNEQLLWLVRQLLEADENAPLAGGPWLPNSWLDEAGIRQSLNALVRKNGSHLLEYGHPFGYLPLREHLTLTLAGLGITAQSDQILLTNGTSQALELVITCLLKPGDVAMVDDPGYYNMFGNLRLRGIEMLAVPRNRDGPDVSFLEAMARERRPKVYFTQSVMQNPTGTDMSPHVAFRVLQAAERHNFAIVEDDIFSDLQARQTPRLATLDQLNRVIYARSFSKTLSGSLRVGFIACSRSLANQLADIKMLTSITSSQFTERVIYLMLVEVTTVNMSRACRNGWVQRASMPRALSSVWDLNCSLSLRMECSSGRDCPTLRIRLRSRRPPNVASCWRRACSFVLISTRRLGCGSTSWSATTSGFKDYWSRSYRLCVRRASGRGRWARVPHGRGALEGRSERAARMIFFWLVESLEEHQKRGILD